MSVVDNLTLEMVIQALDKVKAEYEKDNERLVVITPDLYDQTYDIMGNHFIPDEPLSMAFGVFWSKEMEFITLEHLKSNTSICMISNDTNEIMGARVNCPVKPYDPTADLANFQDEALRGVITFLNSADEESNFMERYGVDGVIHDVMHFFALGVNKKYRRMGLGGRLLAASMAMSRELGFKVIKGEGTSNFSQRIYEKQGFEILHKVPYDSYKHKGRPIREGTGEHTMTKIYGLRLGCQTIDNRE